MFLGNKKIMTLYCWEISIDDMDRVFFCELPDRHEQAHEWTLQDICLHNASTLTHTNGNIECLSCHEIIMKGEQKW